MRFACCSSLKCQALPGRPSKGVLFRVYSRDSFYSDLSADFAATYPHTKDGPTLAPAPG